MYKGSKDLMLVIRLILGDFRCTNILEEPHLIDYFLKTPFRSTAEYQTKYVKVDFSVGVGAFVIGLSKISFLFSCEKNR